MSDKKCQKINCSVRSCAFNEDTDCTLDSIKVIPCRGASSHSPEDSMCGSFRAR